MKKLFSLIAIALLCVTVSNGQFLTARWGSGPPSNDNTGRVLTYAINTVADAKFMDTIKLVPNAFQTFIIPSAKVQDSVAYIIKSNALSYAGDQLTFVFQMGATTGCIEWLNQGSGKNTFSTAAGDSIFHNSVANKHAAITFQFDGVNWEEIARPVTLSK